MHGHGTTCPERVAADIFSVIAKLVEANLVSCILDGSVNLSLVNIFGVMWCRVISVEVCVGIATIGHDVMNVAGKCFDRAVISAGALLVDALTLDAVLLVGNTESGLCRCKKGGKRGSVGDEATPRVPECDVSKAEGLSKPPLSARVLSVFSHPQQIVESNADEVCNGVGPGFVVLGIAGLAEDVLD